MIEREKIFSDRERSIFGVKKFHSYLYGHQLTLITDYKPFWVPPLVARWAMILATYSYKIEYRPTGAHANADSLSRLPLKGEGTITSEEPALFNISQLESLPITTKQLRAATRTDPILSKVLHYVRTGWPNIEVTRSYVLTGHGGLS